MEKDRTIRIVSLEVSPYLVLLNIRKVDLQNFRYFLKVTSSQNTFKWAPNESPKGPLPWLPLGSQGFPSHGGSGTPSHGIPWAPKGSLSHGSPPMGSLWAPKGPLPWDPTLSNRPIFVRPGKKITTKELTRGFLARSHLCKIMPFGSHFHDFVAS